MASCAIVAVVDDDLDIRESVKSLVLSLGYEVILYDSGDALLDDYSERLCACIVSDVQMPGINGLELARRILATDSSIPVILMSAYANPEIEAKAASIGVRWFFRKPFDPARFADAIIDVLEQPQGGAGSNG